MECRGPEYMETLWKARGFHQLCVSWSVGGSLFQRDSREVPCEGEGIVGGALSTETHLIFILEGSEDLKRF